VYPSLSQRVQNGFSLVQRNFEAEHLSQESLSLGVPNTSSSLQTPKLKDSCDKCSASKLRCTKEKPFCSGYMTCRGPIRLFTVSILWELVS
jgi:hypothetical protein